VPELVQRGQVRWFSKDVKGRDVIERISIESFSNEIAPTFVGITVELAPAGANPQSTATAAAPEASLGAGSEGLNSSCRLLSAATRVLIFGGGSSHDFDRWFNQEDSKTLSAGGKATVKYTDKPADIPGALPGLEVLYLSSNQPMKNPGLHKAIFDFAEAGNGL